MREWILRIMISLILCFSLVTLIACSNNAKIQTDIQPASINKTEDTSNDLVNMIKNSSLSQKNKDYLLDSCALGITDDIEIKDINSNISLSDFTKMMQKAIELKYGTSSDFLNDFMKESHNLRSVQADGYTTRLSMAEIVFYTSCEKEFSIPYTSFSNFIDNSVGAFWNEEGSWRYFPNATLMGKTLDGQLSANADVWSICTDLGEVDKYGNATAIQYALNAFDRMSSERVLSLFEDNSFHPNDKISAADAILSVYHYYRWLMVPNYKVLEDVGLYNKDIITDDLLKENTSLPDASNNKLPDWKGFNVDHLSNITHGALSGMPELWTFEADIRTIAEAGGDFANVRVGWGSLSGPDFSDDDMVNMSEIEYLDRIVSWGMKYGIHIQFCFTEGPAMDREFDMQQSWDKTRTVFTDQNYRELNTRYWRMLAKRYADIPNKYLSFKLMNECSPLNDENYGETMAPIVKAIRDESPDRVILADVHAQTSITGESMAKMGVALCAHLYDPSEVFVIMNETMSANPDFYNNLSWPYILDKDTGEQVSGKKILDMEYNGVSVNAVKKTAEKYGVGFMVGEFGFFGGDTAGIMIEAPIPRETIYTILKDIINTFDEEGIPWCTEYRTEFTLTNSYDIDKNIDYEIIEGSPLYLDRNMLDFYKDMTSNK